MASVTDPDGVVDAVTLHYRVAGSGEDAWDTIALTQQGAGAGAFWSAALPGSAVTGKGVDYYLSAADEAGHEAAHPPTAPVTWHHFTVEVEDLAGPSLSVTSVADGQPEAAPVLIEATVDDPSGVSAVALFYRSETTSFVAAVMTAFGGGTCQGTIPGSAVLQPGVD